MTDFGEILEPSSRAFWDEFDYENVEDTEAKNKHQSDIEWEWSTDNKIEPNYSDINAFYVIEGTGIKDFVKSTIIKNQIPVGGLKNKNVLMYHFAETNHIIVVSTENNLNISSIVAKYFENYLKIAKEVFTFSLQSKIQYKGENIKEMESSLVFLRGINSKFDYIEELQSPNFITGIAAGVATIRFLNQLSYSSYIAYMDPLNELDAFATTPILKLFNNINIQCDKMYISKFKDPSLLYM